MDNAFKFVKAKGIVHEDEYPYVPKVNKCKMATGPFKISGYTDMKSCTALANAITGRPVSCLLYTSPSPRDLSTSRMPSSA